MWGAVIGDLAGSIYEFEQTKLYKDYEPDYKPYFKTSFSPGFIKWCNSSEIGTSIGNGAMMRISSIGFSFENERDVKENARLATIPSHNSKETIVYSTLIALIIFYTKHNLSKAEILKKLNIELKYKPFEKFNSTCSQTFNNCVFAAFNSNNFEESIIEVLSYGGDTDTNACIVGAIAEAMYGVSPKLIKKAKEYIPNDFIEILEREYKSKEEIERL